VSDNYGSEGRIYWDGQQFAFRDLDGTTYFDHQDWIGTERARTNYQGALAFTVWSLPFGDDSNQQVTSSGPGQDNAGFAYLEFDQETLTDHAQYRQYSPAEGRWFSPDPYDGSYDMNNPQSFNRYSYVMNSPVAFNDPSGQVTPGPALFDIIGLDWAYLAFQEAEALSSLLRLPPSNALNNPPKPKSPARQACEQKAQQKLSSAKRGAFFNAANSTGLGLIVGAGVNGAAGCAVGAEVGGVVGLVATPFSAGASDFAGAPVGCVVGGTSAVLTNLAPNLGMSATVASAQYGLDVQSAQQAYNQDMQACSQIP
jgi:RHS repeat-associated protein